MSATIPPGAPDGHAAVSQPDADGGVVSGARSRGVELDRLRQEVAWLQAERTALRWAAGHDELTGLANRRLFDSLASALLAAQPCGLVVAVMDLDGFKPVNDRFGHDVGDAVLRVVADRLARCAGGDPVARLGGDEFAALLRVHGDGRRWSQRIAAVCASIHAPMRVAGRVLTVSASIGVAGADAQAGVPELLRRADLAMYRAKLRGHCTARWDEDQAGRTAQGGNPPPQLTPPAGQRREVCPGAAAGTPPPNAVELTVSHPHEAGPRHPVRRPGDRDDR